MKHPATALWLALAYGAFIVYGSLVPLDFHPLPFDVAWERFRHTPFLALDIDSRADWVANGVLYAPLGLFATLAGIDRSFDRGSDRGHGLATAMLFSIVVCSLLAVGVEFVQLYFPPRTVSLNDIMAEGIGSVVGAVAAPLLASWLRRFGAGWRSGGTRMLPRLLELYVGAYLLLCFFPYDLLLSASEVHGKWISDRWGPWIAPHEHGLFFVAVQWAVEVVIALPIGALPMLQVGRRDDPSPLRLVRAAVFGLVLGLVIEVGQFFVFSGVSQGISVLSRGAGVAAGAALAPWLRSIGWRGARGVARPWAWPLAIAYLPMLAAVNGAFGRSWHGWAVAAASWETTRLLPFYYHYYTTEALAVFSLGSVALMYAPVVALAWLRGASLAVTAAVTAVMATTVEIAKLFMDGAHADPTNVLVAVAVNISLHRLLSMAQRSNPNAYANASPIPSIAAPVRVGRSSRAPWLLVLPLAIFGSATFPAFPIALTTTLIIAAALVWRRPVLALGLIPAALPILDFAPWSGRYFLDEFDLFQMVCLAVAFNRVPAVAKTDRLGREMTAFWMLLGLSLALSTWRGLASAGWPDANSFGTALSPYNALRIVKGAIGALLFTMLWRRLEPVGTRRATWLGGGMLLGLTSTVLVVAWERMTFARLLDFAADFRVTGPFSAMHLGGAYIECYLAVGAAFAIVEVLRPGSLLRRAAASILLAATGYAMLVTYSRNGYAALAVVVVTTLLATFFSLSSRAADRRPRIVGGIVVGLLFALGLSVVWGGGYARQRLSQSGQDLAVRRAHWVDGLALRDHGPLGLVIGTGLGRYPWAHFWNSREPVHAASFALGRDADGPYLRLAQGATLYIEQIIDRPPFGALTATFEMRGAAPGTSTPALTICEKWTLTSLACAVAGKPTTGVAEAGWQRVSVKLDASALLVRRAPWRAPLHFTLSTPAQGTVDVRRFSVVTPFGDELLVNGNFDRNLDRWFFSTDVDPPWHLHNLPLSVLFDQGWLGVLAWSAVLMGAAVIGTRRLWRGESQVPAALPALLGFLASGLLNTLIDEPRFLWLLLVLAWLATQSTAVRNRAAPSPVYAHADSQARPAA